jgi:hypothetical protein
MNQPIGLSKGKDGVYAVPAAQGFEADEREVLGQIFSCLETERKRTKSSRLSHSAHFRDIIPRVSGIESISGMGEDITICLDEPLSISLVKHVFENNNPYFLEKQYIAGNEFFTVMRKGKASTLWKPIIALRHLFDESLYMHVPKGKQNVICATEALGMYLKRTYGILSFRKD